MTSQRTVMLMRALSKMAIQTGVTFDPFLI